LDEYSDEESSEYEGDPMTPYHSVAAITAGEGNNGEEEEERDVAEIETGEDDEEVDEATIRLMVEMFKKGQIKLPLKKSTSESTAKRRKVAIYGHPIRLCTRKANLLLSSYRQLSDLLRLCRRTKRSRRFQTINPLLYLQLSPQPNADRDVAIHCCNQAVVMQLATRRVVRPSRKAKEIADAEKEMQSKGKKKGVSARDTRFARNFALDKD